MFEKGALFDLARPKAATKYLKLIGGRALSAFSRDKYGLGEIKKAFFGSLFCLSMSNSFLG
jgi:hypothetical protein